MSIYYYQNPNDFYPEHHRPIGCRNCNANLASDNPASQYQRQKIIQRTVRVQSSLYTMNLAGLSSYQSPLSTSQIVEQAGTPYFVPKNTNWNQMSDRASPAVQRVKTGSGSGYRSNSTKHSIMRERPGALSPGGIGVDIKHNSYNRYLNKLKGKSPLRRGIVSPNPLTQGGKNIKTVIVNGCDCSSKNTDELIYKPVSNAIQDLIMNISYQFTVGDFIWAKRDIGGNNLWDKAIIKNIEDDIYTIEFVNDGTTTITNKNEIIIYFKCDCQERISFVDTILNIKDNSAYNISDYIKSTSDLDCNILQLLLAENVF